MLAFAAPAMLLVGIRFIMRTVSLVTAWLVFVATANGAPPLGIQGAVEVKFGTSNNRIYQLEGASPAAIDVWKPVAPAKWGRGKTVTNVVPIAAGSQLIFRTKEYDLTNGLAYYFPLDGFYAIGETPIIYVAGYGTSRFGTPRRAAVQSRWDYNSATSTTVREFAVGTDDFTISSWVMSQDSPHVFGRVFGDVPRSATSTNVFQLSLVAADSGAIELYFGGTAVPIFVTQPLGWEQDRWYFFQLVRQGNVFRIYRDTELVGEFVSAVPNNQHSLTIFIGPETGAVDDVRFYKRALSEDEIGVLFRLEED